MYNEQLEKLIDYALADGELTEKEKQVLFKKAESLGVDLDEFEMVLEARLFEKQKENKSTENTATASPQSDKFGDIKKCPACGAIVQSFQTKCTECGYEFSNIGSNSSITKLFKMLDEVESARNTQSAGHMLADAFFFGMGNRIDFRKKEIIKNFPVPTTKEDILEFLSLAVPNARKMGNFFTVIWADPSKIKMSHNAFVPVWKAKCEQIIMKARFSMKEDKETLAQINEYAKQLKIK